MRAALILVAIAACGGRSTVDRRARDAIDLPIVVTAELDAVELERRVAIPIERAINAIPGVAHVRTTVVPGLATIDLELAPEADLFTVRTEVIRRLGDADLPDGVVPGLGVTNRRGAAILRYTISYARWSPLELTRWQDATVRVALLQVPGVVEIATCGRVDERWVVDVDPQKLAALGLVVADVATALRARSLDLGRLGLKAVGETRIPNSVAVEDIADLRVGGGPRTCHALDDHGDDVIAGTVYPLLDVDPLVVRAAVEAALERARASAPPGVALAVLPRTRPIALAVDEREPVAAAPADLRLLRDALERVPGVEHVVVEHGRPDGGLVVDADTAQIHVVPAAGADARGI